MNVSLLKFLSIHFDFKFNFWIIVFELCIRTTCTSISKSLEWRNTWTGSILFKSLLYKKATWRKTEICIIIQCTVLFICTVFLLCYFIVSNIAIFMIVKFSAQNHVLGVKHVLMNNRNELNENVCLYCTIRYCTQNSLDQRHLKFLFWVWNVAECHSDCLASTRLSSIPSANK